MPLPEDEKLWDSMHIFFATAKGNVRRNDLSDFHEIRVSGKIAAGDSPGHLVTVFALQTALYHLPLASALAAYAWFELESGLPPAHRDRPGTAAEALDLFAAALPQVRLAMGADRDEFSDDAPRLRAI
jgi:DNA gyrase/topoisomerase IV subunit A